MTKEEAAEAEAKRVNHTDSWVQHEMRKCLEIGFLAGVAWRDNNPSEATLEVVEALKLYVDQEEWMIPSYGTEALEIWSKK